MINTPKAMRHVTHVSTHIILVYIQSVVYDMPANSYSGFDSGG
jgi:hypothetical protein